MDNLIMPIGTKFTAYHPQTGTIPYEYAGIDADGWDECYCHLVRRLDYPENAHVEKKWFEVRKIKSEKYLMLAKEIRVVVAKAEGR